MINSYMGSEPLKGFVIVQIAIIKYHRLSSIINTKRLFRTALESRRLRSRWTMMGCCWGPYSGTIFWAHSWLDPHMEIDWESYLSSFMKALVPFMRVPFLWLNYFANTSLPNAITIFRLQHRALNSEHSTLGLQIQVLFTFTCKNTFIAS